MSTLSDLVQAQGREIKYLTSEEKLLISGLARNWDVSDPMCGPYPSGGPHCDEYPFWTSEEGEPGSSLRMIPAAPNTLEGVYLNGFATVCGLKLAPAGTEDRAFLVIPIPSENGPPTAGVCAI